MRDAFATIYHSKLYIGIDTVWMHACVAFDKPMVLCMGVTGPETQYIRNATIIRPMKYTRPATPSKDHAHGAVLKPADIELAISTKLSNDGEVIDNRIPFEEEDGKLIQYV
jgi:ADP-heptose:LPS heptosyltransferase